MITLISLVNNQKFFPFWGDSIFLYLDRGIRHTSVSTIHQNSLKGTHKTCAFDYANFATSKQTTVNEY